MKNHITKTAIFLLITAVIILITWCLFPKIYNENIYFLLGVTGGVIGFWIGWLLKGLQLHDAWGVAAAFTLAIIFMMAGCYYVHH